MPRLFIDNLTVIDCSILDPERGMIGASWSVDIELAGELDAQSMVFDFAKVKKTIKATIDQEVDHKLLVPSDYSGTTLSQQDGKLTVSFLDQQARLITHGSPASAVCQIKSERISRIAVISYLTDLLLQVLPNNITELVINLNQEQAAGNYYSYSHGLKKHDGNCQRIAHGHRSQIQIWQADSRADQLEKELAQQWQDIYLGTREDIVRQEAGRIGFAYTTDQGLFELEMDQDRVHLMNCDSTIECIAQHIVGLLQAQSEPPANLKVKAFEGIGKGAIAGTSGAIAETSGATAGIKDAVAQSSSE